MVWEPDGRVVTNRHVVAEATRIQLAFADGKRSSVRVLATDEVTDLAVLETDRRDLPGVTFADGLPSVGELAVAIGKVAAGLLALVLGACGSGDARPATQPAPGVTTFEEGRFDDLPQFPRSEPLGPRSEKEGVVTRSYEARGTSPDRVLEFYREALDEGWNMVTSIEKLGVGTFRAEWVDENYHLLVSATRGPALGPPDDVSNEAVAQYSLTLHPL